MADPRLLHEAARRVIDRSSSLCAKVLFQYCREKGVTSVDLASQLGIPERDLDRLALCRQPETIEDVRSIARFTGARAEILATIFGIGEE